MTVQRGGRAAAIIVFAALTIASAIWSMTIGAAKLPLAVVLDALLEFDGSREHLIVTTVRLPRMLSGLLAGSALAVAGAIMQAVTNNPLASPGILGINAGAAFAIVTSTAFMGAAGSGAFIWAAFLGAAVAAVLVYTVGSVGRGGATPLKLALAGAILSAFIGSLTSAVLIFDKATLDVVRVWSVGSLEGRTLENVTVVEPYVLTGLVLALLFRGQIATLSLGAETAGQLGQNLVLWRLVAGAMVVLLAGSAVALTGPIGFVGLFVPHTARLLIGGDYRWTIPLGAVIGAFVVVFSDALLQAMLPEKTLPVGIAMALVGAPFFIYLARARSGSSRAAAA